MRDMELDRIDATTRVRADPVCPNGLPPMPPSIRTWVNLSQSRGEIQQLPTQWRAAADQLRHYAAAGHAQLLEVCADELDAALRAGEEAVLTLGHAATESGLTADHLARQIRAGRIPNAGRPHAPRIRRADLPCKSGRVAKGTTLAYDPLANARSLRAGRLQPIGGAMTSRGWHQVDGKWSCSLGERGIRIRLFENRRGGVFYRAVWQTGRGKEQKIARHDRPEAGRAAGQERYSSALGRGRPAL